MNPPVQIITTGDGSPSLLNTTLNETYHSQHGAVQESKHVFLKHGLDFYLWQNSKETVNIFEVGFGTGLNVWLTMNASKAIKQKIVFTSIEAFPLDVEVWSQLSYTDDEDLKAIFNKIHLAPWNEEALIDPLFLLNKVHASLHEYALPSSAFDLIYFDAFAPSKQPEMWELSILEKVTGSMASGGVFVTYCAKGQLKRDLRVLGLAVETLPGPPGKNEMVRAVKI
jgi:tRNA U34 5-methylaminomethyl-2-thiouridine-forming methyltransferase MnmC